jgi:Trm5-related predicted tRNA methylase
MAASNFNLRGIPSDIMNTLKKEAKRLHMSVNALALKMIEQGLGLSHERFVYHDLDHLAGSWSSEEEKAFKKDTKSFEKIDKEMWK